MSPNKLRESINLKHSNKEDVDYISDTTSKNNEQNALKDSQEKNDILKQKIENLENAQDIIFEQFRELELQRVGIEKQKQRLEDSSSKNRVRTIELFGRMIDLKKAKKTISLQNETLEHQQKEIEKHQTLLENSSQKFRERTIELFGKMIDLKKAKKTISLQNEELEEQRKLLRELNASKDKFFSIVAHDLRNPIAGFLNLTDVLATNFNVFSEDESKEFITVMNEASKQLYNLLENLLQWSRSQTGSIKYEPQYISAKKMIDETIDALLVNIENKKLKVNIKVDEKLIAFVDENMITTVIRNLISNAIKFSTQSGVINIRAEQNKNSIVLSIIDNGVGMTIENKNKLFKIDQHLTTPGTSDEKGSGLGLILCKEFIDKNGGNIWVESELNKGSSFSFSIPNKQNTQINS
jgi:signal transduction histidine kinase